MPDRANVDAVKAGIAHYTPDTRRFAKRRAKLVPEAATVAVVARPWLKCKRLGRLALIETFHEAVAGQTTHHASVK
jgi:hypothetical protein